MQRLPGLTNVKATSRAATAVEEVNVNLSHLERLDGCEGGGVGTGVTFPVAAGKGA